MSEAPTRARETVREVVKLDLLQPVYRRPALDEYLAQLWDRRHFIRADARGRVVSGSRGMVLGMAWLVLRPLLDGAAYYVIFGMILGTDRGIENFVGYLLIGVFLFAFTSRSLNQGASALVAGKNLVKAFTFPRASLPIAVVVRETLTTVPVIGVLVALILLLPPQEGITWRWALFPVILLMQTAFNFGIALWAARIVARVPDLNQVLSIGTRFWLYGSGVFFSIDQFVSHEGWASLLKLNPMYVVLDMSRDVLLYAETPDAGSWAVLTVWTVVAAVGGLVYFWRGEERYGAL
ncbi:ABC transporter permease [Cellulomonas carbonis]|uniref:Transport permease protein n=1 Tax=Cellulomonas carbonis T26 TaxID=947969 RepID=A0A0A0BU48_9CELL|nr:ABC transporter permease [Cellulomonas carbonis]KGM11451.1 phosphate ABC transporter permease [Cellulomonas carbonis T26]GGC10745.1 transport permease protein [Cellulomonas carbonis]